MCRASTRDTSSPRCAVASFETGRYLVHTSTQFPALVRDRTAETLGVRSSAVRIIADTVGGGFGGKLDAGPEPYAALLSRHARRPVKLVYTRGEEFVAGTMRENAMVRLRSAVTREGDVVGQEAEWLMDAGAYAGRDAGDRGHRDSSRSPAATASERFATAAMRSTRTRRRRARSAASAARTRSSRPSAHGPHRDRARARPPRAADAQRVPGDRMPNGQSFTTRRSRRPSRASRRSRPGRSSACGRPNHGVAIAAVTWLTNPMAGSATLKLNEDGTIGLITAATDIGSGAVSTGLARSSPTSWGSIRGTCRSTPPTPMRRPTTRAPRAAARSTTSATRSCARRARCAARSSSARRTSWRRPQEDLRARRRTRGGRRFAAAADPAGRGGRAALSEGGPIAATGSSVSAPPPADHDDARRVLPALQRADVARASGRGRGRSRHRAGDHPALRRRPGRRADHQPERDRGADPRRGAQGIGYALYENIRIEQGRIGVRSRELPAAGGAGRPAHRDRSCSSTPTQPGRTVPRASASRRSCPPPR